MTDTENLEQNNAHETAEVSTEASEYAEGLRDAENGVHKLIRNGLAIMGKIEHFSEKELETLTHWVAGRL